LFYIVYALTPVEFPESTVSVIERQQTCKNEMKIKKEKEKQIIRDNERKPVVC